MALASPHLVRSRFSWRLRCRGIQTGSMTAAEVIRAAMESSPVDDIRSGERQVMLSFAAHPEAAAAVDDAIAWFERHLISVWRPGPTIGTYALEELTVSTGQAWTSPTELRRPPVWNGARRASTEPRSSTDTGED